MRQTILYIGMSEELDIWSKELANYLVKQLLPHYYVDLVGDLFDRQVACVKPFYDLVIVQNARCWVRYKMILDRLSKCPVLFVSDTGYLNSYIAPRKNLFGVINLGKSLLTAWGIPEELQLRLDYPVEKVGNYYIYEEQISVYRVVYCPTGRSLIENDLKLLNYLQKSNVSLTIVTDRYEQLKKAFSPFVTLVSRHALLPAIKKAHLVVASGYDVIRALAFCKPCIVLGDYGLGGLVTLANFAHLQSVYFRGRNGGCFGEMVPTVLLEEEMRRIFDVNQRESSLEIQKRILSAYDKKDFDKSFLQYIEQTISLFKSMKSRNKRFLLRSRLSSLFVLKESEGKQYLMRGQTCFFELEAEMLDLLKLCDGTVSVHELAERYGYNQEETEILWLNLYDLWKEKLILFML